MSKVQKSIGSHDPMDFWRVDCFCYLRLSAVFKDGKKWEDLTEKELEKEQRAAADEYVAHLAEKAMNEGELKADEQTTWQNILSTLKELLGKLFGPNAKITDEDIISLLNISYRAQIENIQELRNSGAVEDSDFRFSIRTKPAPKKTGIGYKVFYLGKDGKLYPPMVANPNGEDTPVGVWLDADAAPIAGESKTGRKKVKAGGKGTQGGSGTLAYRPGWHLGEIPFALQFNRGEKVDNPLGIRNEKGEVIKVGKYFPKNFVWAEVEYANDVDYQNEAMSYGYNNAGNFQHSLAGLPRVPEDGSYKYRTNANPATDPWIITGAMKVNRVLSKQEVDDLVRANGREPQEVESDNTRFSITPQQDQEYMEAVNSGDMEKAGQMVKAAADKAGYNSPMVYHGTVNGSFVTFNTNNQRTNAPDNTYWFTSKRKVAEDYTTDESGSKAQNPKVYPVYLAMSNPFEIDAEGSNYNEIVKTYEIDDENGNTKLFTTLNDAREYAKKHNLDKSDISVRDLQTTDDIARQAIKDGYDGVIVRNVQDGSSAIADDYIVFNPNQIKSAEPVTYDDEGNVIPLSERFAESEDIRYSVGQGGYDFFDDDTSAKELKSVEPLDSRREYDINKVVELYEKYSTDSEQKELANRVFDVASKLGFKIMFNQTDLGFNIGGRQDGDVIKYSRMTTLERNKDKMPNILLHEVIHGVTVYCIDAYKNGELKNQKLVEAVEEINDVYNKVKGNSDLRGEYGLKNEKELVAEMANPIFRNKLKKIGLWERLKDAIKKLFFFEKKQDVTANKVLSDALDKMLDNYDANLFETYNRTQNINEDDWNFYEDLNLSIGGLNESEAAEAKAMEKVTKSEDVRFSVILGDKKDNNGNRFFEKDGTIDLWRLDDLFRKAGREIAPIRLTDKNVNHTLKNHNDFFKNIGDVIEYTDYVLQNANVMRKTTNTSVYVSVEVENDPDKTAILRLYLSDYGDYYNVETVGNRRKGFLNNEKFEIIARRSEPFKNEAASFSARPTPQQSNNGNEESNATDAIISFGKGTINSPTDQTNSQENSNNLQSTNNEDFRPSIDPEILSMGIELATFHIEAGSRKFSDFAQNMVEDFGDTIRPYLKSFYNGVRDLPEVEEYRSEMDSYDEVSKIDVNNLDNEAEKKS